MEYDDGRKPIFNAGLAVSLAIEETIKNCEDCLRVGDFIRWQRELTILHSRLTKKLRDNKKARAEVDKAKQDQERILELYERKVKLNRPIPRAITNQLNTYFLTYERTLRYYVDKFGFGAVETDDYASAAFR